MKDLAQVHGSVSVKDSSRVCTVGRPAGRPASTTAAEPPVQFGGDRAHKSVSCKIAGSECQSAAAVLERFSTEQPVRHNTGHQQNAATHWLPAWYSTGHSLCSGQSARVPERQSARVPECQSESAGVGESGRHLDGVTQDGTMALF